MVEQYMVVWASDEQDGVEAELALAAAMTLTQQDYEDIASGLPVSKAIPDCLTLNVIVKVDSEGVIWFERKRL